MLGTSVITASPRSAARWRRSSPPSCPWHRPAARRVGAFRPGHRFARFAKLQVMDSRALDELQSLALRDEELSAAITRLQQQETAVAHIRARSEAIDGFFAAYPEQGSRLQADVADSEHSLAERRREVAELERDLGLARTEDDRERIEKAIARGRVRDAAADSRLTRARSAHQELEEAGRDAPHRAGTVRARSKRATHRRCESAAGRDGAWRALRVGVLCAFRPLPCGQPTRYRT